MNILLSPGFYIFNIIGFFIFLTCNYDQNYRAGLSIGSAIVLLLAVAILLAIRTTRNILIRNGRIEDFLGTIGSCFLWISGLWISNTDSGTLVSPPALAAYFSIGLLAVSIFPISSIFRKSQPPR
jgi:hypothetical protein